MLERRHLKALRGAVTAVFAMFVALMSHIAAGAEVPGPLGVILPLALALPICIAISGRRLSFLALSASVVVSQALFHALFIFGTVSLASPRGHGHHSGAVSLPIEQAADTHSHSLMEASPAMLITHLIAAAVTVATLHRGEVAFRTLLLAGSRMLGLRRALLVLIPAPEKPTAAGIPAPALAPRVARARELLPVHAYRGPPLVLVSRGSTK